MADTKSPNLFVRNATGLVKEFSFLDQFLMSQLIINILAGAVYTAVFAPYFFPGANLPLVFLIGAVPAAAMAVVYSKLTAAMPRSGGDYVWSTRIIGPLYGLVQMLFIVAATVLVDAFTLYNTVVIGMSQFILALGFANNNPSQISLAKSVSSVGFGFWIDMGLLILATLMCIFGLRLYHWFQTIGMSIYYLAALSFIVMLFVISPLNVPGQFNHAMQVVGSTATYNGVIQQAQSKGFFGGNFNLTNTILAGIPWGFLTFVAFNYGSYLGGETKNAKSSVGRALYLSIAVTVIGLGIMGVMYYRDFGATFVNAASFVAATNSSALPSLPTANLLVSFINAPVGMFVSFGMIIAGVIGVASNFLTVARSIFAASFDRLLPAKFASVNERLHTPHWAVLTMVVATGAYLIVYWNYGFAAAFLNTSLISPIGYMLPFIAALLFPVLKKDLFDRTLGRKNRLAVIAASLIGIVSFGLYTLAETVPILSGVFLGSNLLLAYSNTAGIVILGLIIYSIAVIRVRGKGLNLKSIFSEIPPE
jgi:APA family basic amino acid/polyamine antiporter